MLLLRKLFGWLAKSIHVDDVDTWASLPTDLLLEIVLRLEPTTVVRCACVCKPWRRAIVGNAAAILRRRRRPHLDRFDPSLLLGIFHMNDDNNETWLRRAPDPSPFQSALPSTGGGRHDHETVESFIPADAAAGAGAIRGLYSELLCSSDGFILLRARIADRLCLCNPVTGDCTFLHPPASFTNYVYVLLTTGAHDDLWPSGPGGTRNDDDLAVRILAVKVKGTYNNVASNEETERLTYQVFSIISGDGGAAAAGTWGPVKRSVGEMRQGVYPWMERRNTVVCRGTVHWLAGPGGRCYITGTVAIDVHTGRTWTTELPRQCYGIGIDEDEQPMLATSADGWLSLIRSLRGPQIQVWVLMNNDDVAPQWTLQHTISIQVQNLWPYFPDDDDDTPWYKNNLTYLSAFCPKSGCVVGMWLDKVLVIDIGDISSRSPVRCIGSCRGSLECCPYEMDCSLAYISKMKCF